MKKIVIILLFFIFLDSPLISKGYYLVILKGGTEIKATAISKQDGYIKVYKYGGYIIYPEKNIKNIKYIKESKLADIKPKNSDQSSNKNKTKCLLKLSNFFAKPFFNKLNAIYNVSINGKIVNNCPVPFKDVNLVIVFLDKNKKKVEERKIHFREISAFSNVKINKIFNDINADNVKFYKYKLEYLREK